MKMCSKAFILLVVKSMQSERMKAKVIYDSFTARIAIARSIASKVSKKKMSRMTETR